MKKVVYNSCHGGFSLSKLSAMWLAARGYDPAVEFLATLGKDPSPWSASFYPSTLERHAELLVECIEAVGLDKAGGEFSELRIIEVQDKYRIDEYDGYETVETPETISWKSVNDPDERRFPTH